MRIQANTERFSVELGEALTIWGRSDVGNCSYA
jgi:hypothetical protein